MICNALGPSPDDGLLECRCRRHQALGYLPLENQAVGDIIPEPAAESCEDCVECSGLDAAQMCCWFSRLWPRHWHGAYACFSTMAGTRVAHLILPFQRPNALSPWGRLKCTVFSQPICETSGAANPTISTFTSAGLPLATARDRASSNWSGAVTYSPCPPSAAAARS